MICQTSGDPDLAEKLKALAHPARLKILRALAGHEKSCCRDLVCTLDLAQSTVSQHLKILAEAGLIENGARGLRAAYRVRWQAIEDLKGQLGGLFDCLSADNPAPAPEAGEASNLTL